MGEVEAALADLEAKKARAQSLRDELREAEAALQQAYESVRSARVKADDGLPRAHVLRRARYTGAVSKQEVVIVRRTSKQIVVRSIGGADEMAFRQGWAGRWWRYPRKEDGELEIAS